MAAEETTVWQTHGHLDVVLELVFLWLGGEDLARCGALCQVWWHVSRRARAWRQLLCARGHASVHALADVYGGACPWRELYVASTAPWRRVARLAPERQTRLAAAALNRAGDMLAIAAEDCSFTIWALERDHWSRVGAGSVALGWTGVARAEWAPDAPLLLLAGPAPLSAQRGALAVLRPRNEGSWESWVVAARASGGGGCWAGEGFLSLELTRLSAPQHAPVFATDVWLNAATQEAEDEFKGTAARVLRVYNEARAVIMQALCADVPLDARTAQEWAEAEATARTENACAEADNLPLEEFGPNEAYYRVIYDRGREADNAWVRVVVLACGSVLGAWTLPRTRPPPLSVPATALRQRVLARAERRQREAEAVAAGEEAEEAPELTTAELRARCDPPTARLRLPGPALGLTALDNGRAAWASVTGGAVCASLPSLRVLRVVLTAPGASSPHYLQPHASREYFCSPCGSGSGAARVWGPAGGAGGRLADDGAAPAPPALAALLPRARARAPTALTALLLTEDDMHSQRQCSSCAGRGTPPACPPCESAPPPPCRTSAEAPLYGQRVVCCAPPQGQRPPCLKAEPECARTCEHQLSQKEHVKKTTGPKKLCGAARDAVTQRLLDNEEYRRRLYERAAAERTGRPPKKPLPQMYHIKPAKEYAIATDGRTYAVVADAPVPRCPATSSHCSAPHPPPQPVTLAPLGDCRSKDRSVIDPCTNKPKTILAIDRGDPELARSASLKPVHENPKNDKTCYKGITSRIMDSLRSGRDKQPEWCGKPPPAASPTPPCRPPTIADRIRRKSPKHCKRQFHTSAADLTNKDAPKASGRESLQAASKKLAAVLSERDSLKEAGRGRVVRSPSCAPPKPPTPPPKPRENGGAMEFSIPAGADTVCVRVSMGKASPLIPPRPSACPPPSCSLPRPPQSASDPWLSIKKLQKKISSCGRSEAPTAPDTKTPAPDKPKPPSPCAPKGKVKMNDVLPHTIFVK